VKRLLALVLGAGLLVAACADVADEVRVGPLPTCDTTSRGLLLLMAQAVPSADFVPCLESLPEGWALERTRVETGRAVLTLDNAGVGDVVVTLAESCDQEGASITDAGPPGSRVYENAVGQVTVRATVFSGGCITVERPSRLSAAEMTGRISYLSRDFLRASSDLDL
jgi:hypothetical protein